MDATDQSQRVNAIRRKQKLPNMANRKNNKNQQRGFTLIEVISVLVIIGVVAAVVVSRMMSPSSFGVVSEADILKGHLRYAQYRAMSHSETWGIQFTTNGYSLVCPSTITTCKLPNEVDETHTLSSGIKISTGVDTAVHFNEWGNPVNNTTGALLSDTTISLKDASITRTFKITQNTGFIE